MVPPANEPVALDCEMVQVGNNPVLAQVVIVDANEHVVFSEMVLPPSGQVVTTYITWITGFTKDSFKNAIAFDKCMEQVRSILQGRILVGHNLVSDFKAMHYTHPIELVRDTASHQLYQSENTITTKEVDADGNPVVKKRFQARKLKVISEEFLGVKMQKKIHFAAEDAIAAMRLYLKDRVNWEAGLADALARTRAQQQRQREKKAAAAASKRARMESNSEAAGGHGGDHVQQQYSNAN
jgi:RNA exonuclease 4